MRNTDGQFGLKHCDWEKGEQTFHPVQIKQIVQHYNLLVYLFFIPSNVPCIHDL